MPSLINIKRRNNIAETYRQNIKSNYIKHIEPIEGQTYWRYNLLVDISERNNLLKKLREENILASTWYPPIAHLFFNDFDMISFPKSYLFTEKVINLFVDYRIDKATINKTIDIINQF